MKQDGKQPNYHDNHRILRIRNPWGFGEWELKWSEKEDEDDSKLTEHWSAIQ